MVYKFDPENNNALKITNEKEIKDLLKNYKYLAEKKYIDTEFLDIWKKVTEANIKLPYTLNSSVFNVSLFEFNNKSVKSKL
jgi:hypothetical protein